MVQTPCVIRDNCKFKLLVYFRVDWGQRVMLCSRTAYVVKVRINQYNDIFFSCCIGEEQRIDTYLIVVFFTHCFSHSVAWLTVLSRLLIEQLQTIETVGSLGSFAERGYYMARLFPSDCEFPRGKRLERRQLKIVMDAADLLMTWRTSDCSLTFDFNDILLKDAFM